MINMSTRAFALTVIAPATALLPIAMSHRVQGLSNTDVVALHASFDPSLAALRAGRVEAPAPLATHARAELCAAQQHTTSLATLRAGDGPSDNEWKWLAIGAGVVLLIILL
jgi:hypothetical protein